MKEEEAAKTAWRKKGQAYRRRRHEQGGTKGNILIYIKVEAGKTRKERDADGWLEARGTGGLRKGRDGNGRPDRHAKAETCAYRTKSHKPGREREQHVYIPYTTQPLPTEQKSTPAESGFTTGAQNGDRRKRQKTSTQGKGQHTRNRSQELSGRTTGHIPKGNKYAEK